MDIDGVIQWLFKWWVILSAVFWGFIGTVYCILVYVTYRLTKAR
jgi:hypothetical protein